MTKIIFYKTNGVFYGFEEQGHTGYGESGDDILCSALSAMTMLIINAIEVSYASDVEYTIDDATADIDLAAPASPWTKSSYIPYQRQRPGQPSQSVP